MSNVTVQAIGEPPLAIITLDDPDHRNALSIEMLGDLLEALRGIGQRDDVNAVLLRGEGPCFCAGFDLAAVVEDPMALNQLVELLGEATRLLRRLPQVVVIAAHGVAIAGGCALLSAADVVFVGEKTRVGYPVHRIGISPAVTTPTLRQAAGDGRTREILLGGDLFMGTEARRQGIASHVVSEDDVLTAATAWARDAAGRPAGAMRTTKQWLSELDGSSDDAIFDGPVAGSAPLAGGREAVRMLEAFWNSKRSS